MRRKLLVVLLLLPLLLGQEKCSQPLQQSARDAIAAAKGFIEQAQRNHGPECSAVPQCELPTVKDKQLCKGICDAINKAVGAQNLAVDALSAYCAGPAAPDQKTWADGGPCSPLPGVESRLREAISNLDKSLASAKELAR